MKKILTVLLAAALCLTLCACSSSAPSTTVKTNSFKTYGDIENAMKEDVDATVKKVNDALDNLLKIIDGKYDNYIKNKDKVDGWYKMQQSEFEAACLRLDNYVDAYYRMICDETGLDDYSEWNDAISDCYDVWEDYLSDLYYGFDDVIYDSYRELSDAVDDGRDSLDYDEYSNVWEAMYDQYDEAWDLMYDTYDATWDNNYTKYDVIWDGFYSENKDIDALLKDAEKAIQGYWSKEEENTDSSEQGDSGKDDNSKNESENVPAEDKTDVVAEEPITPENNDSSSANGGICSEFQKAMDDYKAFFEEYCVFMKKYSESDNAMSMMTDYLKYMAKYQEAMEALEDIDENDLSYEENLLYMQTMIEIEAMLIKAIQ